MAPFIRERNGTNGTERNGTESYYTGPGNMGSFEGVHKRMMGNVQPRSISFPFVPKSSGKERFAFRVSTF